ncbi:MAG: hypothetical protein A2Z05_03910 [Chloroflexi bacterium RBG_16_60_22]|nr:MAG: hypothetical protein A2Z05_03910 [Chloroflexi bacterium RBG_16_60_22]
MGGPGPLPLLLHLPLEAVHVHREAGLLHNLLRQLHGEAVGIVEAESLRPGYLFFLPGALNGHHPLDNLQPGVQRFLKPRLLQLDYFLDKAPPLLQLGIDVAHPADGRIRNPGQERLVQPQPPAEKRRPA